MSSWKVDSQAASPSYDRINLGAGYEKGAASKRPLAQVRGQDSRVSRLPSRISILRQLPSQDQPLSGIVRDSLPPRLRPLAVNTTWVNR